ncbi:hypothetical protein [Bacillus thuringiensis]|uniref:hypothetical protein n=1 Tax=Bacillus thuringiensis TaxID=1428 RepID=UPI000BFB2F14|nr:hypothetical protein [Bacillus thuringiensis]PGT89796.1 hypothetical protein COD17_08580 [Bacillus thuringiensis]
MNLGKKELITAHEDLTNVKEKLGEYNNILWAMSIVAMLLACAGIISNSIISDFPKEMLWLGIVISILIPCVYIGIVCVLTVRIVRLRKREKVLEQVLGLRG